MCSIAGFLSKNPILPYEAERLASGLLYYGSERGEQSSGIFVNDKLLKSATDPCEFMQTKEFSDLFKQPVKQALIHTRHPTCGGRGDAQAQPFVVGTTATIHNGWFNNIEELKRKWEIRKKSGVDSELLTQFIHSYGIKKLPKFLSSTSGSSAFGIIHNDKMYLMRSGNPTAYTYLDMSDGNSIFIFASTPKILANAVRYCYLIPNSQPFRETKEGILFEVTQTGLKAISNKVSAKMWVFGNPGVGTSVIHDPYYVPRYKSFKDIDPTVDVDDLTDEEWKAYIEELGLRNAYRGGTANDD